MQSNENLGAEIAGALEMAGLETSGEHDLQFYFYFPDSLSAERLAATLRQEGFECLVEESTEGVDWLCLARKSMLIDVAALSEMGKYFSRLAFELDGQFDGWERVPADDDRLPPAMALMEAVTLSEQGNLHEAAAILEVLVESPNELASDIYPLLGLVQFKLENYERAAECFRRDIEIEGESAESLVNLGSALFKMGDLPEAARCYRSALQHNQMEANAHYGLACVYAASDKAGEALDALRLAVRLNDSLRSHAATDPDLSTLRTNEQFTQLVAVR